METIKIDNITYLVQRSFIGKKTVSALVQEQLRSSSSKSLPLTGTSGIPYNNLGNSFRCEEAQ